MVRFCQRQERTAQVGELGIWREGFASRLPRCRHAGRRTQQFERSIAAAGAATSTTSAAASAAANAAANAATTATTATAATAATGTAATAPTCPSLPHRALDGAQLPPKERCEMCRDICQLCRGSGVVY